MSVGAVLKEREDLLPFFRSHLHLSAFVGSYHTNVLINSNKVHCITFDQLYQDLLERLDAFPQS